MPALPEDSTIREGILKGGYCYRRSNNAQGEVVNLLSSGAIMQQALQAADMLETLGYRVHVWSMTSFNELARDAQDCERWSRLHPTEPARQPYVKQLFSQEDGVFIAVTDYMKALPNSIARWMPAHYETLGTDGYGLSESRQCLRDYFEISAQCIVQATVSTLFRAGHIDKKQLDTHWPGNT